MREFLEELDRRKRAKEDPCHDCDATGGVDRKVCVSCLGQGVLLSRKEYDTLLAIAVDEDNAILSRQVFDE